MRRVTPGLAPGFAPPEVIFSHKEHPETATDASSETTCWGNQEQGFKTEHTYASVPAGFYNQQWSVAAYGLPLGCELALAADEGVGPTGPSSRTTLQIAGPAPALTNIVAAVVAEFGPKPAPLNS